MENKDKIIVRAVFSPEEMVSVNFLLKTFNLKKPHDLIRFLVTRVFTEEKSNDRRYGKSSRLERKDARKEELSAIEEEYKAMDPVDLTMKLLEVGYFPKDAEMEDQPGVILKHRIVVDEATGEKTYEQHHYNTNDAIISYKRTIFTFNELMADLKKEKKI